MEGKKISAHENRLFINIASPLKKKFTTIDPTTGPEGQLRTGGWRFFFGGAGGWRFFFGGGGKHMVFRENKMGISCCQQSKKVEL